MALGAPWGGQSLAGGERGTIAWGVNAGLDASTDGRSRLVICKWEAQAGVATLQGREVMRTVGECRSTRASKDNYRSWGASRKCRAWLHWRKERTKTGEVPLIGEGHVW